MEKWMNLYMIQWTCIIPDSLQRRSYSLFIGGRGEKNYYVGLSVAIDKVTNKEKSKSKCAPKSSFGWEETKTEKIRNRIMVKISQNVCKMECQNYAYIIDKNNNKKQKTRVAKILQFEFSNK